MACNKYNVKTVKGFVNYRFLHDTNGKVYKLSGFTTLLGYEEDGFFCICPCEQVENTYNCIRYISVSNRKVGYAEFREGEQYPMSS